MNENYTAEDFAQARLATRGEYMVARRCGVERAPWAVYVQNRPTLYVSDANMALGDWVPVFTSAAGNDRRVERLKRQVTEQDITICRRNRQIEELNSRIRALEDVEPEKEPWRGLFDAMPLNWTDDSREYAAKRLYEAGARMGEK